MKERPILFSGAMVRAILGGAKTQTRRVIKPQPIVWNDGETAHMAWKDKINTPLIIGPDCLARFCPYGVAGDRLWVRETWARHIIGDADHVVYRADCGDDGDAAPWRPSIHMPRRASRITLGIVNIRVERLQDIEPSDCRAEGVGYDHQLDSLMPATGWREAFADLWNSINAARGYGWDVNPWVWVIEFPHINSAAIRQAAGGQADRSNEAL